MTDCTTLAPSAHDAPEAIGRLLGDHGWAVWPDFLDQHTITCLAGELIALRQEDELRQAGVGRSGNRTLHPEIRGDRIAWLGDGAASPAQRTYLERIEGLRLAINARLFLGLFEFEGHFALYPPGAFYRKHLDRFQGTTARTVTCVLYLNPDWAATDGGQLRLYLDESGEGAFVDIAPTAGTLVAFLSERFFHEVLPAGRERMSLTGWFKTRS